MARRGMSGRLIAHLAANALLLMAMAALRWGSTYSAPEDVGRRQWRAQDEEVAMLFMAAPSLTLSGSSSGISPLKPGCDHFSCVDVSRCGASHDRVLVHVPRPVRHLDPRDGREVAPLSRDFFDLLQAVMGSPHHTDDPEEACLVIPPIDLLSGGGGDAETVGRALASSELWNGGTNNLIFVMSPATPAAGAGSAILASSAFSTRNYRPGFDVAIPTLSPSVQREMTTSSHPNQTEAVEEGITRDWLLLALPPVSRTLLPPYEELERREPGKFALVRHCTNTTDGVLRRCLVGGRRRDYSSLLRRSNFCLVSPGEEGGSPVAHGALVEAMHHGCLPVLVEESESAVAVLPFSEKLDWPRFSARLPGPAAVGRGAVSLLEALSPERVAEMRRTMRVVYGRHFRSVGAVALTTLEILQGRLLPPLDRPMSEWNDGADSPTPVGLFGGGNPLSLPHVPSEAEGFTAVILTYDRPDTLFTLINR